MTRWEAPVNLEDALREIARGAEGNPLPTPKGYSLAQITEREKEMDWPIPQEIRALYHWFTPLRWKAAINNRDYADSIPQGASPWFTNPYLMPLEDAGWRNRHGEVISKEIRFAPHTVRERAANWESSFNFCFAASDLGEEIVYCLNPPELNPGIIVCWYQTGGPRGILLGNSLAQWLARFHACSDCEFALAAGNIDATDEEEKLDGIKGLKEPLRSDFLRDHLRLNPDDEYARKLLTRKFGE